MPKGTIKKLTCQECGTAFQCGSAPDKNCWCMNLPNLRGRFDLAGTCLCPNCLTLGKAKAITKMRKAKQSVRKNNAIR